MEQPEIQARHRIVIARIAHVQKTQQLLVDEIKPQEAVIFARSAAHREIEIGRISQRRQDMPGRGDQQRHQQAAQRMQRFPDFALETTAG